MQPLQRRHNKVRERRLQVSTQASSWVNFTPLSLSPLAWFDASDTSTITESGGAVSQWNDKSGNGINVTQGTAALQPTTGTSTIAGKNVLSFSGDALRSANGAITASSLSGFIVFSTTSTSPFVQIMIGIPQAETTHTTPFFRWLLGLASTNLNFRIAATSVAGGTVVANTPTVAWGQSSNYDAYLNLNRVIDQTGTTVSYPNSVPLLIGANAANFETFGGLIAEILFFDRELTLNEAYLLNYYFKSKWGVIL